MFSFFRSSAAESWALASVFALGFSLQALWIFALLIHRSSEAAEWFTFFPFAGPISGWYLCTALVYAISFFSWAFWYHKRDVSHHRANIVKFAFVSLLLYFFFSLPNIFSFSVSFSS
jgi:hypothetical protein